MDLELLIGTDVALAVNSSRTTRSTLAGDIFQAQIGIREMHRSNGLGTILLVLETELLPRVAAPPDSSPSVSTNPE